MTQNIPALIVKLQQQLDALGDGRDARSDNERATYRRNYDTTQACISGLKDDQLARLTASIEEWEAQRVAYLAKEKEIEQAIATAPEWTAIADTRLRGQEVEWQRNLTLQLQLLRDGRLFVAPGVTYGRLDSIDARIAELTRRRDRAQSALDAHLKTAEQLLAVTA